MLIDGADPSAAAKPDERLIKLLIRVRRFNALTGSDGVPFASFAEQEGVSPSYFTRLVRLSYLAPDITQPIRDERQAPALTQTSCRNTRDCRWLSSSSGTTSVLREPISALSFILSILQDPERPNRAWRRCPHRREPIDDTAVLEYRPTETLPFPARCCGTLRVSGDPAARARPHTG
jgi:hypothetical protein